MNEIICSDGASINAGKSNLIEKSDYAAIIGGFNNYVRDNSKNSVIAGGKDNRIVEQAQNSFIGSGIGNIISAQYAAIAGGMHNTVSSNFGFIGAGFANYVSGRFSAVLGGSKNTIYGRSNVAFGYRANVGQRAQPVDRSVVFSLAERNDPCEVRGSNTFQVCAENIDLQLTGDMIVNGKRVVTRDNADADEVSGKRHLSISVEEQTLIDILSDRVEILRSKIRELEGNL